jgi:hypothetical protein
MQEISQEYLVLFRAVADAEEALRAAAGKAHRTPNGSRRKLYLGEGPESNTKPTERRNQKTK